jgi:hypothetical protein
MAGRNELQRQSGSEGGVGQPEATHPEVLGVAWGSESVSVASGWNRAHAQGIGDFFSGARARPQREVEADRGPQQLARPTRLWRTEREREPVERVRDTGRVGWSGFGPLRRK